MVRDWRVRRRRSQLDLAYAVGNLELMKIRATQSGGSGEEIERVIAQLAIAAERLAQLRQVSRVAVKETPLGPALDLDRSTR